MQADRHGEGGETGDAVIRKAKVCLVGAPRVGKTSLAKRFLRDAYREEDARTSGLHIESRLVEATAGRLQLVVWDLNGDDPFQNVQPAYLSGTAGYLLVVDGTRRETKNVAIALQHRVTAAIGPTPFVVVLNKVDGSMQWELDDVDVDDMLGRGWTFLEASAKTGAHVNDAFQRLTDLLLAEQPWTYAAF
jgi:small GTP-binding protein